MTTTISILALLRPDSSLICLTRFNKIAIQGTPQMAVDKEATAYRESTHIVILSVPYPYRPTKYNLP